MKELFLAIREQLKQVEGFVFIDKDKGQLLQPGEHGRYPVNFPCALFNLESQTRRESDSGSIKRVTVTVTLTMAWQFPPMADGFVPDETLEESLEYYDTIDDLESKLSGFKTTVDGHQTESFVQVSFREDNADKLTLAQVAYQTSYVAY